MQTVSILGSTGSIGVNTLDVISRQPDRYRVFALSAHSRVDTMTAQCMQYKPRYAVMVSEPVPKCCRAPKRWNGWLRTMRSRP